MFNQKLGNIAFEHIVTQNMIVNLEATLNEVVSENSFIDHLHISTQLAYQHNVHNYNLERSNGFTILIKEEDGKYSYQVAVCNKTDNFDRKKGRYFSLLRAINNGFIDVPEHALAHTKEDLYSKQLAVVNYFIKSVHNYVPPTMVKIKDSDLKVPLKDINKAFVKTLEDVALGPVGKTLQVKFSTNKHTGFVLALYVPSEKITDDSEYKRALELAKSLPIGKVVITKHGKDNKWYDRYHALYDLMSLVINQNKV